MGTLAVLAPVWKPGYPWGSDTWGHLQRAAFMGRLMREQGAFQGFAASAWMPDWYMGDPALVYYPPLTMWLLGPLTALFGDVFVVYRLLVTAIFLTLGLSIYFIGIRWGGHRWLAAAGALVAVTAPYTVRTVFVEGNFPRGLALLCLPWIIWYSEQILVKKRVNWTLARLAILWALVILAHVMQAAIFAVALALYVVFRILSNVYIPLRRGILVMVPVLLGGGLAALYLFPAYSHRELANVPSLAAAKIDIFSISTSAVLPNQANIEAISLGIASVAVALVFTFRTTKEHHRALLATGLVCLVLAFGPSGGIYRLLPLHEQLLPERFLNVSALCFPLIIATTPRGVWKWRWVVLLVAVVLIVDSRPARRAIFVRPMPPDERAIAGELAQQSSAGRVANLTFPNPDASQLYLNSEVGKRANVFGWALENTPHANAVRRLLIGLEEAPEYLQRVLSLWNTDYLVTRLVSDATVDPAQPLAGFDLVAEDDGLTLWEREQPSALVQVLPSNRMLIIGDNPTDWAFTFPFATEGQYANPADYEPDYFERFSVIGLTRLPGNAVIQPTLTDWVNQGHTLIVDLSGLGQIYDEGYTLFGVHALPMSISGDCTAHWPAELGDLPGTLSFSTLGGSWVGATYYSLDTTVVSLTCGEKEYPLLGYRDVGEGRVWFVGFNLFYFLRQTAANPVSAELVDYLLAGTGVDRALTLPALTTELLRNDSTAVTFRYTSPTAVSAVVSMTYFPRWQARIEGKRIAIQDHEHLMLLELPAGTHTVELTYHALGTTAPRLGYVLSGLSLVVTLFAAYRLRRHPPLAVEDRVDLFQDRLPQTNPLDSTEYAVCPNCSFRLAKSGPPNEKSYPFAALDCPICGFSLGDTNFIPGAALREETRRTLATLWLRRSSISDQQLQEQFGLTPDELFVPEGTIIGEPIPDTDTGDAQPPLPDDWTPGGAARPEL